jgi:hypothetical protein
MLNVWMRLCSPVRPWMAAVALAGAVVLPSCRRSASSSGSLPDAAMATAPEAAGDACEMGTIYGPGPCDRDDECRTCGHQFDWAGTCSRPPDPGGSPERPATMRFEADYFRAREPASGTTLDICTDYRPNLPQTDARWPSQPLEGSEAYAPMLQRRLPIVLRGWYAQAVRDFPEVRGELSLRLIVAGADGKVSVQVEQAPSGAEATAFAGSLRAAFAGAALVDEPLGRDFHIRITAALLPAKPARCQDGGG